VSIRVRIHRALFDACVSQERVQIQLCSVSVGGPLRRLPEVILYVVRNLGGYSCRAPKAAYRALRDKGERIAQSEIQRRGISPPLSRISRHARQLQLEMWHKRCTPATATLARCYLADFSSRPQKLIFTLIDYVMLAQALNLRCTVTKPRKDFLAACPHRLSRMLDSHRRLLESNRMP
jgi:hypothetical protein